MKKQYDDFTKMNVTDMSNSISDMTYHYINPETNQPTIVPAAHYKTILNDIKEKYVDEITRVQFLKIMYNQLKTLKEEDSRYFQEALLCLELKLKPDDLRVNERIALAETQQWLEHRSESEKNKFHLLDSHILEHFEGIKNDRDLHKSIIEMSSDTNDIEIEIGF